MIEVRTFASKYLTIYFKKLRAGPVYCFITYIEYNVEDNIFVKLDLSTPTALTKGTKLLWYFSKIMYQ